VSVGAQFHPKSNSFELIDKKISYWKKIQYRIGFHYEKTYLQLKDNQLNDMGVSIGFGLPVLRSAATLHLSAEAGKRGTISNNLLQENYLKFSLGFTLNDRWFIKQKFE